MWALQADPKGGTRLGQPVADTLDELRAMLPRGLTRGERTSGNAVGRDRGVGLGPPIAKTSQSLHVLRAIPPAD